MYGLHVNNIIGCSVEVNRNSNRRNSAVYLDDKEIKDLIEAVGDAGCLLFNYYITKSHTRNFQFTDEGVVKKLGWDLSKVKRIRLKLKRLGWVNQEISKSPTGDKYLHTFLGREKVAMKFGVAKSYWNDPVKLNLVYEKYGLNSLAQFLKNELARKYYEELV